MLKKIVESKKKSHQKIKRNTKKQMKSLKERERGRGKQKKSTPKKGGFS